MKWWLLGMAAVMAFAAAGIGVAFALAEVFTRFGWQPFVVTGVLAMILVYGKYAGYALETEWKRRKERKRGRA
jgi:hypothetical protein